MVVVNESKPATPRGLTVKVSQSFVLFFHKGVYWFEIHEDSISTESNAVKTVFLKIPHLHKSRCECVAIIWCYTNELLKLILHFKMRKQFICLYLPKWNYLTSLRLWVTTDTQREREVESTNDPTHIWKYNIQFALRKLDYIKRKRYSSREYTNYNRCHLFFFFVFKTIMRCIVNKTIDIQTYAKNIDKIDFNVIKWVLKWAKMSQPQRKISRENGNIMMWCLAFCCFYFYLSVFHSSVPWICSTVSLCAVGSFWCAMLKMLCATKLKTESLKSTEPNVMCFSNDRGYVHKT